MLNLFVRKILLIGFTLIFIGQSLTVFAQAQNNSNDAAKLRQQLESTIERRAKFLLSNQIDDYVSRRIDKSQYLVDIEVSINKQKVNNLVSSFAEAEIGVLKESIASQTYDQLRQYLSEANISVGFSENLDRREWNSVSANLEEYLAASTGESPEAVETRVVPLPRTAVEQAIKLEAEEKRKNIDYAERSELRVKKSESEFRKDEIKLNHELELQRDKKKERELESELNSEREKKRELADLLNKETMLERAAKEWPIISRLATAGVGVGFVFLIALVVFGIFVFSAFKILGNFFKQGSEDVAGAIRDAAKTPRESKEQEAQNDTEKDEDQNSDFESPSIKQTALELKTLIEADISTSSALISKMVESGKFGEAVSILDSLGTALAQKVFGGLTASAKDLLQRTFFSGEINRPNSKQLFAAMIDLRSMLSTTGVLLSGESEKSFAQIVLSYSDEDIANAAMSLEVQESAAMFSALPASRLTQILRKLPEEKGRALRRALGDVVRSGIRVSDNTIKQFSMALSDENKVKFEANKKYLKNIIEVSEEAEAEDIILGLENEPKLLLEVIGMRATIDDLWAQPTPIIDGLLSIVELEVAVALMYSATEMVRNNIIAGFPDRKKTLTADILDNLNKDDVYRNKAVANSNVARKSILGKLAEMATAGSVELPSRQKLLDAIQKQEEAAKANSTAENAA